MRSSPYERRVDLVICGFAHIADGLALIVTLGSWRPTFSLKAALRKALQEKMRYDTRDHVWLDAYDAGFGGQGG